MELILADENLKDIEKIQDADADIDIGGNNDMEIKVPRGSWGPEMNFSKVIYIPGTEYGGIVRILKTDTTLDYIALGGRTWRGKLEKKIIVPPAGQDYKKVSGELNQVLAGLINGQFGDYFVVSQEDTGVMVSNYQFERYCTTLFGVEKMLKSVGHRLQIKYVQMEKGVPGYVELGAVPIKDYSGEIELSQDSKLNFTFEDNRDGINHLVCLGKGELQDRQVIDLYVQKNGSIDTTPYYTGIDENAEVYEDTSSETAELQEKGVEKLRELMNKTTFNMDVESLGIEVAIGDIVGGRDYLTGMYAKKPIKQKVYTIQGGEPSIEYSVEGDDEQGN